MKSFREFLTESRENVLVAFDVDDTLFHTFATVKVVKDGKEIHALSNQEFNTYKLKDGESYDFSEFKDAKKFKETSKVIDKMMSTAIAILRNVLNKPGSEMIILTARSDFDDKEHFLQTFRDHGLDIDKIYVERAGNLGTGSSASNKVHILKKYLDTRKFNKVQLFDDAMSNLNAMLNMKNDYPDVVFKAYLALHDGSIKHIR